MLQIPPEKIDLTAVLSQSRVVWSGSASAVAMSSLSEGGAGLYLIKDFTQKYYAVHVWSTEQETRGASENMVVSSPTIAIRGGRYSPGVGFRRVQTLASGSSAADTNQTIEEIRKVGP